jgi:hypothetical protein
LEDFSDPSESPFCKAMAASVGTLSVVDKNGKVFERIWCDLGFDVLTATWAAKAFRTQ